MATRILALTKDGLGTSNFYTGLDAVPNGLTSVYNELHDYERTAINAEDPLKMAVVGDNKVAISVDGGDNWTSAALGAAGTIRQVQWTTENELYVLTSSALMFSSNSGATFVGISLPATVGAGPLMDMVWKGTDQGVILLSGSLVGGFLHRTDDGGLTWVTTDLSSMLLPAEAPRRVANQGGPISELIFLTSHRLRYLLNIDALLPYFTTTAVWDHNAAIATAFPGYPATGYGGGSDANNRFDDIVWRSNRVLVGGYNALRAHGQSAPLGSAITMYLTNPSLATASPSLVDYYTHSALNAFAVFAGSSQLSTSLFPYRPGLNSSVDGGISTTTFQLFARTERLLHHSSIADVSVAGCTDPTSCNYDESFNTDNGTCIDAVQLVNCLTNDIIHTASPGFKRLACHGPRSLISVQMLDPAVASQVIGITIDGVLSVNYGAMISTSLLPSERLEEFIGGLVYFINSTTSYRASRIPPLDNPVVPGNAGAFYLESADPADVSVTCSAISIGLLGVTTTDLSNIYPGAIVRVAEYPDQCFRVCGQGNCLVSQALTLVSSHNTCYDCLPQETHRICMDCSTQLRVNGVVLGTTCSGCVSAGNSLDFSIQAQFPFHMEEALTPLEEKTEPGTGCPLTLTFTGDRTTLFPIGSVITVFSDDSGLYTVATVVYDSGSDLTTVTTEENFAETGELLEVTVFTECPCTVRTLVQRIDATTGLPVTVYDSTVACVDGLVETDFSVLIEQYGRYQVTIEAQDCGGAKTCQYTLDVCNGFKVTKTDCHTYVISLDRPANALNTGQLYQVEIKDLSDNTVLLNQSIADSNFPFQFVNDDDTVYLITVTAPGGQVWKTEVIDLCDMENCKLRLANAIFCNSDLCATPAGSQIADYNRDELTRMSIVSREIEAAVFSLRYRWTGIPDYGPAQLQDLEMLARMITTLRVSSKRCADCAPTSTTAAPCATC
jgi:hypothetical protein